MEHPDFSPHEEIPLQLPRTEVSKLLLCVDDVDAAHERLRDTCAEYAVEPSEERFAAIFGSVSELTSYFNDMVLRLGLEDMSIDEKVNFVTNVILGKDYDLMKDLRLSTKCKGFVTVKDYPEGKEGLRKFIAKKAFKAKGSEQFAAKMTTLFMESYAGELNHFTSDVRARKAGCKPHAGDEQSIGSRAEDHRDKPVIHVSIGRTAVSESFVLEDGSESDFQYHPYRIEPPLNIHDLEFIGPEFEFTFSDDTGSEGRYWTDPTMQEKQSAKKQRKSLERAIKDGLEQNVNALGDKIIKLTWVVNKPETDNGKS